LNPGLNHWATDPQGPQRLLLPVAAVDRFKQQLATLSPTERGSLKRYDVAKGDTIASISRKFGVDAASIRSANQLNDGLLHPGQSLLIPRGGPRTVVAAEQNGQVKVQNKPGATQILHTVAAGENLLRIAQRYGVTPQEVQRWNGIGSDNAIKLGQRLSIWSTAPIDKSVVKVEKTVTKTTTERKVGYTVQNGDSLTAIANRFNVQIDDILRWNTVNSRALLQPGQRLTLYPGAKQ
jgi:membrane-bound lytic murein transglycosylase D